MSTQHLMSVIVINFLFIISNFQNYSKRADFSWNKTSWHLRPLPVVSALAFVRVGFVSKKPNLYTTIKYTERGGVGLLCDPKRKICSINS